MISRKHTQNTIGLQRQKYFGFLNDNHGEDGAKFLHRVRRSEKEKSDINRFQNRDQKELVVLVDKKNHEIGIAPKETVHTKTTPLHRGFSLFLFNSKNELLLTRRALTKKTFPGVWTNTVCGHPAPGESAVEAAKRRLKEELGIDLDFAMQGVPLIRVVAPYRYRFADANGIVENEICPVLVAQADVEPQLNKKEIEEWKWIGWKEFLKEIKNAPQKYSPWSREEAGIVETKRLGD